MSCQVETSPSSRAEDLFQLSIPAPAISLRTERVSGQAELKYWELTAASSCSPAASPSSPTNYHLGALGSARHKIQISIHISVLQSSEEVKFWLWT